MGSEKAWSLPSHRAMVMKGFSTCTAPEQAFFIFPLDPSKFSGGSVLPERKLLKHSWSHWHLLLFCQQCSNVRYALSCPYVDLWLCAPSLLSLCMLPIILSPWNLEGTVVQNIFRENLFLHLCGPKLEFFIKASIRW